MTPIIGIMMAAYIAFRGLDALTDDTKPWIVKVSALALIVIAVVAAVLLVMAGMDQASSPSLPFNPSIPMR